MGASSPSWQRLQADEAFNWIWPPAHEAKGSLDVLGGIYTRVIRWYRDVHRRETTCRARAYTLPEVTQMLERAGCLASSAYSG